MPDGVDLYLKDWKLFAKCDGGFRKALGRLCRHGGATPVRIVALAASTSSGCIE